MKHHFMLTTALTMLSTGPAEANTNPPPVRTEVNTPLPPRTIVAPPPPAPRPILRRAEKIAGTIGENDYPPRAIRNGEQGTVVTRFTISNSGLVTECTATSETGYEALENETCGLIMRRFRFKPALGYDGKAISETRTQRVTWKLPEEVPEFEAGDFVATFTIQPDGIVSDCIAKGYVRYDFDADTYCVGFVRAEPVRDKDGKPIARKVTVRMSTVIDDLAPPPVPAKTK